MSVSKDKRSTPAGLTYGTISEIKGPLMIIEGVTKASYDELVEIETREGERRLARVLEVGMGKAVVQVFEGTQGLSIEGTVARFLGRVMELGVSEDMLGRVFDGLGRPLDGLPEPIPREFRDVNGEPINPERRDYPSDFIQTGISAIDGMNSLVRGQKLPIFSGAGLPHNMLAAQIARQATVPGKEEEFAVVFAAIGVQNDEARFFKESLEKSGAISRSALFLNLADDPAIERIITPRIALTLAEYLAFWHDYHVLVILTDITNYCESLREISAAREEVPGRKGYPGYMYSVDGSRRVVLRDGRGYVRIVEIGRLFKLLAAENGVYRTPDGGVEWVLAPEWEALTVEANGRATFRPLKRVLRHKYDGFMVKISTQIGETIVTPNHSIYTLSEDGTIKACEAGGLRKGDLIVQIHKPPITDSANSVTAPLAKLLGYYVAEGHGSRDFYYDKRRGRYYEQAAIRIDNAAEEAISETSNLMSINFNTNPSVILSDKLSKTLRVSTGCKDIRAYIAYSLGCGNRANEKRMPTEILSAPEEIKRAFFEAYYRGDGKAQDRRYRTKQFDMVTVSPGLRDDLIWLSKQLFQDRFPSIYKWNGRDVWKVYLSTDLRGRYKLTNDIIAVEVKVIEHIEPAEKYVYDLSVAETENFVDACGLVVLHNTDLASNYERAGRIKGKKGSVTQMPILSMPSDDITHPIPDLTGYITEGQLVLSRELYRKGIYPPINVLMSLSRLMGPGIIAEKRTRADHGDVSNQLYAAYSRAVQLRALAEIVGRSGLSATDIRYLEFGDLFEQKFLKQGYDENRSLDDTLEIAWDILSSLPEQELTKIKEEYIRKYYKAKGG